MSLMSLFPLCSISTFQLSMEFVETITFKQKGFVYTHTSIDKYTINIIIGLDYKNSCDDIS